MRPISVTEKLINVIFTHNSGEYLGFGSFVVILNKSRADAEVFAR
jgi:hypothetical protein